MNKFNFFVDFDEEIDDVLKAASKDPSKKYDNMLIGGRATTSIEDRQGETLCPDGFILDDFLNGGFINLEHYYVRKGDASSIIGHPIDAYVKDNEFYIKAKLWKGSEKAEKLWDTLLTMKANNVPRTLGWSIEGKKLATDPNNKKKITKAKINHCALTFSPIGFNTYADIAKGQQESDFVDLAYSVQETNGQVYLLQIEKDGKVITVNPDYSIDIKPKAMTTDSTRELIKESLKKRSVDIASWDTIMKAINLGYIPKDKLPILMKKLYNTLKIA